MTTLRDLSRHLGISVTQVSRALNGHSDVGAETRDRVMAAAAALNYQPNLSARKLVSGRSGIVALVLPEISSTQYDSLFVQSVGGLSRHFSARGMQFVLHMCGREEDPVRVYERLVNSGSLDGFIVQEPLAGDARIRFLQDRKVPFVLHGRHVAQPDYPFFDIDNEAVGHMLTSTLLQKGHRRIAFLNGRKGFAYCEARAEGYRRAHAEAGIAVDDRMMIYGEMTEGHGLISVAQLWGRGRRPPTAIACGNLFIAKGVFLALDALGLSVPGDVSLVAHDDELPGLNSERLPVPLTVSHSPLQESWKPLADILTRAVEGAPLAELQQLGTVTLLQRASVAGPSKSL